MGGGGSFSVHTILISSNNHDTYEGDGENGIHPGFTEMGMLSVILLDENGPETPFTLFASPQAEDFHSYPVVAVCTAAVWWYVVVYVSHRVGS